MHGASSLTFRAELLLPEGGRSVIVKVAPPGVSPTGNRDVLRQAAVLRALEGESQIRTPRVLLEEEASDLDNPPFFVMDFLDGECVEPVLDDPLPSMPTPEILRPRTLDAVRVLAALHEVDTTAGVFAREVPLSLEQEVGRWERALATVEPALRPSADEVARRLLQTVPPPMPPALLHGDFRLGNLLCRGATVVGVVDWEIWSLGDPRIDLLWFLLFTEPGRLPVAVRPAPGMPRADELVAEYVAARHGADLEALTWFEALIQFKQAAITALIVKHNRRRTHPDVRLERSSRQILPLMDRALALLR
jgi:aminoglycoside phosphotransferase (APT) family kinase protein